MKKITMFFFSACAMVLLTACGSTMATKGSQAAGNETGKLAAQPIQKSSGNGKILVAYFSCTGHTKALVENAAAVLNADLYEIVPEKKYTSEDLNYKDESARATVEQKNRGARPGISGKVVSFEKYDTVVIAYPIWWGQAPRIIDTFMESYDFSGKTIMPICTSASSDAGSSADALRALSAPSAKWVEGKRFSQSTSKENLAKWFSSQQVQ